MQNHFQSWTDYGKFCTSVQRCSRFIHEPAVQSFLDALWATSHERIRTVPAGTQLWRAQLGCEYGRKEHDGDVDEFEWPFSPERMKPLRHSAHEGRVNPKGIPCLYVGSERETAMAEVRPWVGATLSLATLRVERDLTLVDCSVGSGGGSPIFLVEPEGEMRTQAIWRQVDKDFSRPVENEMSTAEYVPTQVIAEFFKQKGIDAIGYKSGLEAGFNLAIFDPALATVVACGLYSADSIRYAFRLSGQGYSV